MSLVLSGDTSIAEAGIIDREILESVLLRRVSKPPRGVWKNKHIAKCFYLKTLRTCDADSMNENLPLLLLVKDFFETFFGGIKMVSPEVYLRSVEITGQHPRARHTCDSQSPSRLPLDGLSFSSASPEAIHTLTSFALTVSQGHESNKTTLHDDTES